MVHPIILFCLLHGSSLSYYNYSLELHSYKGVTLFVVIRWFVLNHSNTRELCFRLNMTLLCQFHMFKIWLSPCKWVGARSICYLWTTVTVIKNKQTQQTMFRSLALKASCLSLGLKIMRPLLNASISLYTINLWIKMQPCQFQPCSEMQALLCSTMHIECNVVLI